MIPIHLIHFICSQPMSATRSSHNVPQPQCLVVTRRHEAFCPASKCIHVIAIVSGKVHWHRAYGPPYARCHCQPPPTNHCSNALAYLDGGRQVSFNRQDDVVAEIRTFLLERVNRVSERSSCAPVWCVRKMKSIQSFSSGSLQRSVRIRIVTPGIRPLCPVSAESLLEEYCNSRLQYGYKNGN
jgi:hypothetical protein